MGVERVEIEVVDRPGPATVCRLEGELDASNAVPFREHLEALLEEGHRDLVLDARALRFLDSTGLRALVAADARYRAAGGAIRVEAPSPAVRGVMEIADVDAHFGVRS